MPTAVELRERVAAERKALADIFEQAGPSIDFEKVTSIGGSTAEKLGAVRKRNEALNTLVAEYEAVSEAEGILRKNADEYKRLSTPTGAPPFPGNGGSAAHESKSLRERIETGAGYAQFVKNGRKGAFNVAEITPQEMKTLITLGTINVQPQRLPGIVEMALEQRTVADLMLDGETNNNTIEYYEETTVTNAAAPTDEGATKPESALGYTLRTEHVRKIPTWIPATDELLADVPAMESQIRGRLTFMVKRAEEGQLLNGDGTGVNLTGLLNRSGIQTQAKGTDPVFDAIFKGMVKVQNIAFADPTGVVMHPTDWQNLALTRTADGLYILGEPNAVAPSRIWGLDVRVTTAAALGTALVGAFKPWAQIFRRENVVITVSTEHSTYFIENKVAILAEERLAIAVYRPAAFCTVTGL